MMITPNDVKLIKFLKSEYYNRRLTLYDVAVELYEAGVTAAIDWRTASDLLQGVK